MTPLNHAPSAAPFTCDNCRQSMTAISTGPPHHPTGSSSSPYLSNNPPVITGMCGYDAAPCEYYCGCSLHFNDNSPYVCWIVVSHDKGPYEGNHDQFMNFQHKLPGDATNELMMRLINFLLTQFQAAGFHSDLLSDIAEIYPNVDFSRSPINPTIISNCDYPEWSIHNSE